MRDARRRLERLEQQINEVLGPPPPTPEEAAAQAEAWNAMVERWVGKLLASMDLERHGWVVNHWVDHLIQIPCEPPCKIPSGLMATLWTLWSWKRDATKPISLPAAVVEVYLAGDAHQQLNTRPHVDCEDCGYILPISFFFVQAKQVNHFERCPLCGGVVGWHAWDIKHGAEGWQNLKPYSQRS